MSRLGHRVAAVIALAVLAAGCGSSEPATPAPSPTGVIQQMVSVSDFVLYDGRFVHVAGMNGADPTSRCEEQSDRAVAKRLVGREQTITVSAVALPIDRDVDSEVPAGYEQADVRTPSLADYAATFAAQAPRAREDACPVVIPEPSTGEGSSSSGESDIDVDVDRDDGESRFCRSRSYC